jgi:hypothetical protein
MDGKKIRLGEGIGQSAQGNARVSPNGQLDSGEVSGYVVWVRRSEENKKEAWDAWDLAVQVLGKDGKDIGSTSIRGLAPPSVSGGTIIEKGVPGVSLSGVSGLSGGQEVTLAGFQTTDKENKIIRKAELKCKALK